MSVNYHAFQNRGVLFSECEAVCEQWHSAFAGFDPERIAGILHLETDENFLYIPYYGNPYRLRLSEGCLEKQTEEGWTDELYFNEAMAIYHLLHYTKDIPTVSGQWVPSYSIDGVVSRNPRVPDPLFSAFCREWTGRAAELAEACGKAGGKRLEKGDAAFQFEVFPCLSLQLVFWDADEDFPAQVQVFADQRVTDFVHFETVGCLISDLMERLSQLGGASEKE
ncbi:MAG: DUF3786 domain-containing protein [Lachnospiraceae bacterium]|nr:DUF3786 domain-containing protein [Lachnospiraceae bacterium]